MGILTLIFLGTLELFFLVWSIMTGDSHSHKRAVVRISTLFLFGVLLASGVYIFSFRYFALLALLVSQALYGVTILVTKKVSQSKTSKAILTFMRNLTITILALFPAIMFPQYKMPELTGMHTITTKKYTWTDTKRVDTYSKTEKNRAVTVDFWYPEEGTEKYPLVVFSHGAFGFSGSNYSTCSNLASHGYVVASIGHTHQAFFTLDTSGKLTTVDPEFIASATEINAYMGSGQEENIFTITQGWMKLRTEDEHFVVDKILSESIQNSPESPFSLINPEKIGLMGHSLGGASSAQVGRERSDIDAVVVLDGTMLGEEVGFENNSVILNNSPYPIPLLNVYAQDHYTNAQTLVGDTYNNFSATRNASIAYTTMIKDSGHLNFTDLPLYSPILAKILGVGTVDAWYCIEMMNTIVLRFFNSFLRGGGEPTIAKEY